MNDKITLTGNIATIIAQICCFENSLPQGAPTSPIVSNMICLKMDRSLAKLAKKYRCLYSRYVDDITFSIKAESFPPELGFKDELGAHVGDELRAVITSNGFTINQEKVFLHSNKSRQRVTGLIVNRRANVPRGFVRQIRGAIFAWKKFGEQAANDVNAAKFYRRSGRVGNAPSLEKVIRGKLDFIKMIKGTEDKVYRNLQSQFVQVCPSYSEIMKKENDMLSRRDFFISHASEDKEEIAKPLVMALIKETISVWYDEYEIKLGDSLRQKINEGLTNSDFGIVVLSKKFFEKNWPKQELDALASLAVADGKKRIIPIWHDVDFEYVANIDPLLAGIRAAKWSDGIGSVITQLKQLLE